MVTKIFKKDLARGLGIVARAATKNDAELSILSNVLLTVDKGRLRLSANDLELSISYWVDAQIIEDGDGIAVPVHALTDLIKALPNDIITLTVNPKTQTLNVCCGQSVADIKGIDAEEFPPMPVADLEDGLDLNVSDMKEIIRQVVFAASTNDPRPVLQGVLVNMTENNLTFAATDGFRISVKKIELSSPVQEPASIIIPARALGELARIAVDGKETIRMILPPGRGQVIFHMKNAELVSKLIDGNFPDYEVFFPKNFRTTVTLSTAAFLKACKQAEIIIRKPYMVYINILPKTEGLGKVEIFAQSKEIGTSDTALDATIAGEGLVIAFNVRYLREALEAITSPNVSLQVNTRNSPAMISPTDNTDFMHAIMPMWM